uniref:ADP-ribosylarginine hydrolase n=1 Tax=Oncorhynchus tshawytscha TaxID=74940 RepID=A0A8C8C911_ONCTS
MVLTHSLLYTHPRLPSARPATLQDYKAAMLLSGVGDALGYRNQLWEYNDSEPAIHQELQELGGLKNITAQLPDWPVSDDTVLHLATAEALTTTGKEGEELLQDVAARYVEGMKDMEGRKPVPSSILGVSQLRSGTEGGFRVPYNPDGTGCGAAMRSMCIGLRYPCPEQLSTLVAIAVEAGRMTQPHPTGFLGAVATALFTSYAVQCRPITTWGLGLVKEACPIAKSFVQFQGFAKWEWYLELRGLSERTGPVHWPASYGHDAPMIALDALLGAGSDWEELMSRGGFHGGDSDSTAVIACCCWGLLHGTEGVPPGNYTHLEYRERLKSSAEKLYALSHTGGDKYDP